MSYAKVIPNFVIDVYAQPYWNFHMVILIFHQGDIPFIQADTEFYTFIIKYTSGDSELYTAWCWSFMQGDAKVYTGWYSSLYSVMLSSMQIYWILHRLILKFMQIYIEIHTRWYRNLYKRYTEVYKGWYWSLYRLKQKFLKADTEGYTGRF